MICKCPECSGYNIYFTILSEHALTGHIFEPMNSGSEPMESIGHSLHIFYCKDCHAVIMPVSLIRKEAAAQNK